MSSFFKYAVCLALCVAGAAQHAVADEVSAVPVTIPGGLSHPALRVCADPNNLPFSNRRGRGFENELARLLAANLGKSVAYTWWPQHRGFVRNTLNAGRCDLIMGVPARYAQVLPTKSYYTSSYVFVTQHERRLHVESFNDPRLRTLKIGVHVVGGGDSAVPPAQALAMHGIVDNVRGYSLYGDYSRPDPPKALIDALAHSQIDVAIAWGPLAGYFARHAAMKLDVTPLPAGMSSALLPMTFDISMGVRRNDAQLQQAVNLFLEHHQAEVEQLLQRYGVPLVKPQSVAQVAGDRQ